MIHIRKATLEDIEQVAQLFDAYRVFYAQESDIDTAQQFLTERISNKESVVFIAENEAKESVGFVQLYPIFSSTRMKRLWLLNDLFIQPNYRGKRISIQLINASKQLVKESNSCGLILETAKDNAIGNALYLREGFTLDTEHNFYEYEVS